MDTIFIQTFIYTLFTVLILSRFNIPVILISLALINLYFPSYLSIRNINLSAISYIIAIVATIYYCFKYKKIDKYSSNIFNINKYYLIILLCWSILNGTLFINSQLEALKITFTQLILATAIFLYIKEKRQIMHIYYILLIFIFIQTLYGYFCYITKSNIVVTMLDIYYKIDNNILESFSNETRGGLEGRIQGFTTHPLEYGGVLLSSFFYFLYMLKWNSKIQYITIIALTLIFFNIILCGNRSSIIALLFGLALFFFQRKIFFKRKVFFLILPIGIYILIAIISPFLKDYQEFTNSIIFFWKESNEVRGSGLSLRLYQLQSSFELISTDPISFLFGLGHGWCRDYALHHNGLHPKLYGFESIVFIGLIEYGVLGFIFITCGLYYLFYKFCKKYSIDPIARCFIIAYFIFAIFTSAYGWRLFLCLLMLILKSDIITSQHITQNSNKNK